MDNELALRLYPGLFWNTLGWIERYPDVESPEAFFQRTHLAWNALTGLLIPAKENVLLFTHSGVIHVIQRLILEQPYSNRDRQPPVPHAVPIPVEYDGDLWRLR